MSGSPAARKSATRSSRWRCWSRSSRSSTRPTAASTSTRCAPSPTASTSCARPDRAIMMITHYKRLLDYVVPDCVHVLQDGRIIQSGDKTLAAEMERQRLRHVRRTARCGVNCMSGTVLDFPVKPEARDYLARFARDAREPGWLAARRQQAMTRFAETGFPGRKNENWRYLDLQPLESRPLLPARPPGRPDIAALEAQLGHFGSPARRLASCWSTAALRRNYRRSPALPACGSGRWPRRWPNGRSWCKPGSRPRPANGPSFAALNARFRRRLCARYRARRRAGGADRDRASRFRCQRGVVSHPRPGVARRRRRASLVETYAGEGRYWRNDVVAVRLGGRRRADAHRAGRGRRRTRCISAQLDATLRAGAVCRVRLLLGGRRVRHEANVRLAGEAPAARSTAASRRWQ